MLAAVETITPEEAHNLLGSNTNNRHVSVRIVRALARDMQDGKWAMNGESIKISESGRLLDGQHRLLAVIESKTTVQMLVVRGLENEVQGTVDLGMRRTFADVLQIDGEANSHNLAAAVRVGWYLEHFNTIRDRHTIPTAAELYEWMNANEQIREWLNIGRNAATAPIRYVPSLATALGYRMGQINLTQAEEFWEMVSHGGSRPGEPVHALREALLRDVGAPRRMSLHDRAAITIKMWNYMRDGREIQIAVFKNNEAFPVLK